MTNRVFTFICFSFLPYFIIGQGKSELRILWDKNASSISNAENLITIHKALSILQDDHIKNSHWIENNWKRKSLGIAYRLSKTILLDFQIDYLVFLTQHEFFGHGYRYRQFDLENNSYFVRPFFPYADGKGFAYFGTPSYDREFGIDELTLMSIGGIEANNILASRLKDKWLLSGQIKYRESLLYFINFHGATSYIFNTKLFPNIEDPSSNDVFSYLNNINFKAGIQDEKSYLITLDQLTIQSSINLINTYQLFAAYTYLKKYLIDGEDTFDLPMFNMREIKWLPAIQYNLSPFGGSFILTNTFLKDDILFELSSNYGKNKANTFGGGGIAIKDKINDSFTLKVKVNFWTQPELILGGQSLKTVTQRTGLGIVSEVDYKPKFSGSTRIHTEFGYKSTGYWEGEKLDKGIILRMGLSIYN